MGPSWPDVQRLLASTKTDRKADIRDRAILLLLAYMDCELVKFGGSALRTLTGSERTLTIARTKQRHARICPLIPFLADVCPHI